MHFVILWSSSNVGNTQMLRTHIKNEKKNLTLTIIPGEIIFFYYPVIVYEEKVKFKLTQFIRMSVKL